MWNSASILFLVFLLSSGALGQKRFGFETGAASVEFAKSFIEMFGPEGFNVKKLAHYVEVLAPALGPAGALFSLLGSIFGTNLEEVDKHLQEARATTLENFRQMKEELNKVQQKLNNIYETILQVSELNKIETERSFLNSIEQAIEDLNLYSENATRQALRRLCDDPMQGPAYILQRLDEYVHRNYLPPFLKTTLMESAHTSVPRLVSITKYIFADVVRAVLYEQTCLGLANASDELKQAMYDRHQKIFQAISKTLIEWEQSLVPSWAASAEFGKVALQFLEKFGSDSTKNWNEYGKLTLDVFYLSAASQLLPLLQEKFGKQTGPFQKIYFSVTLFDNSYNHSLKLFEPYRAQMLNVVLKRGKLEHKTTVIVSWIGLTDSNTTVDQMLEERRNRYNLLTGYQSKSDKVKCFQERAVVEKLIDDKENQDVLLELEPAAFAIFPLDATVTRLGGIGYFLDVCGQKDSVLKQRAFMSIDF